MKAIMLAWIDPSALPALRIAGALFLIINPLAGLWIWRHRRQLFGPNPRIDGDRVAVRGLQVIVLSIPWLFLTFRLVFEWVGLWRSPHRRQMKGKSMSRTIEAIIRHTLAARPATVQRQKRITADWQNGFESGGHTQRKVRLTITSVPAFEPAQ